ncbi:MAG: hypothetical protein IPO21_15645 [Bacteroidales bacterium]|nr:hypothetical protein [Bacteroidales bacterium]
MKKLLILFASILIIYSCTKEEIVTRETFIGYWVGDITTDVYMNDTIYSSLSGESLYTGMTISEGIEEDIIIIDEGEEGEVFCQIDGNKFKSLENQYAYFDMNDGSQTTASVLVEGSYNDEEINISYEYSYTTRGNPVRIVSSGTVTKSKAVQKSVKKIMVSPNKINEIIN